MAELDDKVLANPKTAYETTDLSVGVIAILGAILFVFLVVIPLILRGFYSSSVEDIDRRLTVLPPAPRLQVDPTDDLRAFRAKEDARLNSYGWVDRAKGVVHVPIDAAMKDVAKSGIDGFPKGQSSSKGAP